MSEETYAYVYGRSIGGGNGYTRFYRFTVDGVTYYGKAFSDCEIGDRIKVRYSRSNPKKNKMIMQ